MMSTVGVFFFKAEDGIRAPLWSRGLGDVYTRQRVVLAFDADGAGQVRHGEPQAELLFPFVDPFRGRLPGPIGIERKDDPLGETGHGPGVLRGEGCAACGNRPLYASQVAADHVRVALADHQLVDAAGLRLRPVQPVEHLALGVELCGVRGVLVLGSLAVRELPPPEANGVVLGIEDREEDPGPEEVVLTAPLVDSAKAGGRPVLVGQAQVA